MGRKRNRLSAKLEPDCTADKKMKESKVIIDIPNKEKYDSSNPLVLDAKKKKEKTHRKVHPVAKPLSKKQRKKLEKIIEVKKKKLNRAELLQKLSKVQATTEDLNQLTSTSDMQTYGVKRATNETPHQLSRKISNIKGSNKISASPPEKRLKLDIGNGSEACDSVISSSEDSTDEENRCSEKERGKYSDKDSDSCSDINSEHIEQNCEPCVLIMEDKLCKKSLEEQTCKPALEEKVNVHEPAVFVQVQRTPEIQAAREALPIFSEEQPLVEAIKENPVVIVHGETGSGKTTQVPQFLYEAGFTKNNMLIGITEPRRIAAVTMAARVGKEMNMPNTVSYHIRYEKTVNADTQIKFMTDGVLLKEIKSDFYLSKYSVIIIDEAHERSVFSDILIGLLSRIVQREKIKSKKYPPLKLIIMSATMCVEEFMGNPRLFRTPPFLFKVSSRQYTVQAHFSKHTPDDYVETAYHKVCKIHRQLPPGAILIFLTGEKEINQLCQMLRDTFPFKESDMDTNKTLPTTPTKRRKKNKKEKNEQLCSSLPDIDLDNYTIEPLDTEDLQHQLSEDEELETNNCIIQKFQDSSSSPLHTLPLYSVLPLEEQQKVFDPPPPGSRLCVVSTNVAETSITIPGLKYVIDTGKVKTKVYTSNTGGISKFVITWCSKASANQRTGRAGRTEGGHCYRLFSSAVFENEFPDFCAPEIQRIPADDVLLQMKALGIRRVVDFPFPSPPDTEALKAAEHRLVLLEALENLEEQSGRYTDLKKREFSAPATEFGKIIARFPLSPRYAAMVLLSKKHDCIPYIVAIVCAMTVSEVFLSSTLNVEGDEDNQNIKVVWEGIKKIGAGKGEYLRLGDAMVLLKSVALYEESKNKLKFCFKNSIRHKAMVEIHKMGLQLIKEMNQAFRNLDIPLKLELEHPNEEIVKKLRKIMAAGLIDHIARKFPVEKGKEDKKFKNAYQCLESEEPVFIHPSSILFSELPEYVVYQEIIQTSKNYMKGIIEIEDNWIPGLAKSLCEFSDPLDDPRPYYNSEKDKIFVTMDVTVGRWSWEIRAANTEMPKGIWRYKWFCFFFLDGQIYHFVKKYRLFLNPSTILKKWAGTLAPKIMLFLKAATLEDIDSKTTLEKVWEKDSKYLLKEFLNLLPSEKHSEIESAWPPKSS